MSALAPGPEPRHQAGACQGLLAPLAAVSKRMAKRNQLARWNFSNDHSNVASDSSSAGLWGPSVCYNLLFLDSDDSSLLELPHNHCSRGLKLRSAASPTSGARTLRSSLACSF